MIKPDFPNNLPTWLLVIIICLIAVLLFTQALWLFRSAQKRGIFPWLWGLWGLIHFPMPLVFFYFLVIRKDKLRNKERKM
ncbi:hypothetical protein DW1_1352 [Proteiniborus sp. DW1]|uniref:hypothetical protein n=1 Tax=Proteiniborus sp. DW1 TaxID=1889883 RepID=UPI00092E1EE3|nr:hypothetical protein [Proteiniborus sp. DW1]SCG82924.1 hypothetical protein DW1_1352 [Proteiniborus sp. DW1]